jgi:hypothetical protein
MIIPKVANPLIKGDEFNHKCLFNQTYNIVYSTGPGYVSTTSMLPMPQNVTHPNVNTPEHC